MCDAQLSASVVSAILPGRQIFSPISLSNPLGHSSSESVWTEAGHQMGAEEIQKRKKKPIKTLFLGQ